MGNRKTGGGTGGGTGGTSGGTAGQNRWGGGRETRGTGGGQGYGGWIGGGTYGRYWLGDSNAYSFKEGSFGSKNGSVPAKNSLERTLE